MIDIAAFRLTICAEAELTRSASQVLDVIDNVHRIDRLTTPVITQRLGRWFLLLNLCRE